MVEKKVPRKQKKKIITPLQLPPLPDDIVTRPGFSLLSLSSLDWISFGRKTRSFPFPLFTL